VCYNEVEGGNMSLKIKKSEIEDKVVLALDGDLDTTTAAEAEKRILKAIEKSSKLTLDFKSLEYVSSAGLRVFLIAKKKAEKEAAKITIINMPDKIRQIFDLVGFSGFFEIQ
jgi:anti-anti-sigma factor